MENNEKQRLDITKLNEDPKVREAFDNYKKKVDKFNEQVRNGEKTDVTLAEIVDEYSEIFYDKKLENKLKKTEKELEQWLKEDYEQRLKEFEELETNK